MRFEIDRCPRAVPLGRPRHRHAAAGVGPLRRAPPACSTPRSSTRSRRTTTTSSPRRARVPDLAQGLRRRAVGAGSVVNAALAALVASRCRWPVLVAGLTTLRLPRRRSRPAAHGRATVSVVVPARDEAATLPAPARLAARRSIRGPLEVIVVDDASDRRHRRGRRVARRDRRDRRAPPPAGGQAVGLRTSAPSAPAGTHAAVPRRRHASSPADALGALLAARRPRRPGVGPAAPPHVARLRAAVGVLQRRGDDGLRSVRLAASAAARPWPSALPVHSTAADSTPPAATPRCAARWSRTSHLARRYAAAGSPVHVPRRRRRWCASACTPAALRQLVEGWTQEPGRRRRARPRLAVAGSGGVRRRRGARRRRGSPSRLALAGARSPARRWSPLVCYGVVRRRSCAGCCGRIGTFRWWTSRGLPACRSWRSWRSSPLGRR